MAEEWRFLAALPGISIDQALDAGRVAIVSHSDERCGIGRLAEAQRIRDYLSRFQTIHGAPVSSLLILQRVGTRAATGNDVTFLRNSLAIAVVLLARAKRSRAHHYTGPGFSDIFDLPVVALRRGPGLIIETPGLLSSGPGEEFCGHPSQAYPYGHDEDLRWDKPLLQALLSVWLLPNRGPRAAFRRRVARILEIVYTALRAPAHNLGSGNDWGVVLALWVSAFETLTNVAGQVSFGTVQGLIEGIPWPRKLNRKLVPYEYRSPARRGQPLGRMSRPVQVYGRLYRARNMVLHGEEYERGRLEPGRRHRTWGPLHHEAAIVFRCALLHFLARNGHGQFLAWPPRAQARQMTFLEGLSLARDIGFAHDDYFKGLGRGLRSL